MNSHNVISVLALLVLLPFPSCKNSDPNAQVDEGYVSGNTYTSDEIGWTIEIPDGWKVTSKSKTEKLQDAGKEALSETTDLEIDFSEVKNLISFQKNRYNLFQSTTEPFGDDEETWRENNVTLKQVIGDTYRNQGIKFDTSETTTETIDGLEFEVFTTTLYGPEGEVILTQHMYTGLINGLDFGVNLNSNNAEDEAEMLRAWRASKFRK